MKQLLIFILTITLAVAGRWHLGAQTFGQNRGTMLMPVKTDVIDLLDTGNVPRQRGSGAVVMTLKNNGVNQQKMFIWVEGVPIADSLTSWNAQGIQVMRPRYKSSGNTIMYPRGFWLQAKLGIYANQVTNLIPWLANKGYDNVADRQASIANLSSRISADSTALVTERSQRIASGDTREPVISPGGTGQYWRGDKTWQTFPAIPSSTTQITEGSNLYWLQSRFNTAFSAKSTTDLTEGTRLYYTDSRVLTAVSGAGYVKGVQISIGSVDFTTSTLLGLNATFNVTVPLTFTFPDNNYVPNMVITTSAGLNLLASQFTITTMVRNPGSLVLTIRNNSALTLALTGTVLVSAFRSVQ